jgi:hypothetical protein
MKLKSRFIGFSQFSLKPFSLRIVSAGMSEVRAEPGVAVAAQSAILWIDDHERTSPSSPPSRDGLEGESAFRSPGRIATARRKVGLFISRNYT